ASVNIRHDDPCPLVRQALTVGTTDAMGPAGYNGHPVLESVHCSAFPRQWCLPVRLFNHVLVGESQLRQWLLALSLGTDRRACVAHRLCKTLHDSRRRETRCSFLTTGCVLSACDRASYSQYRSEEHTSELQSR